MGGLKLLDSQQNLNILDNPKTLSLFPGTTHSFSLILKKTHAETEAILQESPYVLPPFQQMASRLPGSLEYKDTTWELSEHGKLFIQMGSDSNLTLKQTEIYNYLDSTAKLTFSTRGTGILQEAKFKFPDGFGGNRAYFSFLDDQDHGWATQRCIKHGSLFECPKDGMKVYKPTLCGKRRLCLICGDKYTTFLAGHSMRLINAISEVVRGLNLISIIYTLPESVQEIIGYDSFKRFNKVCKATMYKYQGGLMPAGVFSSHTWHSKTPLEGWYPHNHSLWLNLVYDKSRSKFSLTESYLDVRKLRRIYRAELSREFPECSIPKEVNIKAEYVPVRDNTRGKIWHMLLYALRMPQTDVVKYSNSKELTEYSDPEKNHLGRILIPPKNWRRTRWFGWLADGVKSRYLKLLNLNPEDFKKDGEEPDIAVYCPICHSVCELSEEFVTVEGMKKDNVHFLYPWDPGGTSENSQDPDKSAPINESEKSMPGASAPSPGTPSPMQIFLDLLKSGITNESNLMCLMVSKGIPGKTAEHILDMALQEGRIFMPNPQEVVLV